MTAFLLLLLGCASEQSVVSVYPMSDIRLFRRISLDLRGVPPSDAELDAFLADPDWRPEAWVDELLESDAFPRQVQDVYRGIYGLQTDYLLVNPAAFGHLSEHSQISFRTSLAEEPLQLIREVVATGLPWTEVVTADWTMGNAWLEQSFPLETNEDPVDPAASVYDSNSWARAKYTDQRPAAGVFGTSSMWLRYTTTFTNANRLRANTIARLALCQDFLTKPILFSRESNLLDEEAVSQAIQNDPSCVSCHQTLDPLAAHLFGFWTVNANSWMEASRYHHHRERTYEQVLGVEPSYYGQESAGLVSLGRLLANDPRFPNCAVEQVAGSLLRRGLTAADAPELSVHRDAFIAGDLDMRALFRSIVLSESYGQHRGTPDTEAPSAKMMSVEQLVHTIELLTGFRWTTGNYDMLDNDIAGVRSLAGGRDGRSALTPRANFNATQLLVQARLAELAVEHAVTRELTLPQDERVLFDELDPSVNIDALPGTAVRAQLVSLHKTILTQVVEPTSPIVDAEVDLLFDLLRLEGDSLQAWKGVAMVLFRDPEFVLY